LLTDERVFCPEVFCPYTCAVAMKRSPEEEQQKEEEKDE